MTSSIDTATRIERLRTLCAAGAERLRLGRAVDRALIPSVSAWSAVMHFDHLVTTTRSILGAVDRILANDAACVPDGDLSPQAARILRAGSIPRGVAEAPAQMRAAESPNPADVAARLAEIASRCGAMAARAAEIDAATLRVPHFALGPMTASQWIAFAQIHFEHHVLIADDCVRAAESESDAAPAGGS